VVVAGSGRFLWRVEYIFNLWIGDRTTLSARAGDLCTTERGLELIAGNWVGLSLCEAVFLTGAIVKKPLDYFVIGLFTLAVHPRNLAS
jgi:hypothetical protein